MGVLSCDRSGCDNIMCDFLSYEHGYLCQDCFNELLEVGPTNLHDFMRTTPSHARVGGANWENFVREEFKYRYEC